MAEFCAAEFCAPCFAMLTRVVELLDGIGFARQHDFLRSLLRFFARVETFPIDSARIPPNVEMGLWLGVHRGHPMSDCQESRRSIHLRSRTAKQQERRRDAGATREGAASRSAFRPRRRPYDGRSQRRVPANLRFVSSRRSGKVASVVYTVRPQEIDFRGRKRTHL